MVDGGRWQSREQSEAERAQNSDLPSVRVDGLRPDTEYEARIAVYDNYSIRSLGKSTGVIEFKTDREFEIHCQFVFNAYRMMVCDTVMSVSLKGKRNFQTDGEVVT